LGIPQKRELYPAAAVITSGRFRTISDCENIFVWRIYDSKREMILIGGWR
jgi:hypothetical protein